MSGGKKKYKKTKTTFTIGEVKRKIQEVADDAVARVLLICVVAAVDMFKLDDDRTVEFIHTMERYIQYEADGTLNLKKYSESLLESTGIDLRLRRWK